MTDVDDLLEEALAGFGGGKPSPKKDDEPAKEEPEKAPEPVPADAEAAPPEPPEPAGEPEPAEESPLAGDAPRERETVKGHASATGAGAGVDEESTGERVVCLQDGTRFLAQDDDSECPMCGATAGQIKLDTRLFTDVRAANERPAAAANVEHDLKIGANPRALDSDRNTPLHLARNLEVVKKLALSGAADAVNKDGNSPVHLRAADGDTEAVEFLCDAVGVKINEPNNEGKVPIDLAPDEATKAPIVRRQMEMVTNSSLAIGEIIHPDKTVVVRAAESGWVVLDSILEGRNAERIEAVDVDDEVVIPAIRASGNEAGKAILTLRHRGHAGLLIPEVQWNAVATQPEALEQVIEVKNRPDALGSLTGETADIRTQLIAVAINPKTIAHIAEPAEVVQALAVSGDKTVLSDIQCDPHETAKGIACGAIDPLDVRAYAYQTRQSLVNNRTPLSVLGVIRDRCRVPEDANLDEKLIEAAEANDVAGVRLLLVAGADPNAVDGDRQTASDLTTDGNIREIISGAIVARAAESVEDAADPSQVEPSGVVEPQAEALEVPGDAPEEPSRTDDLDAPAATGDAERPWHRRPSASTAGTIGGPEPDAAEEIDDLAEEPTRVDEPAPVEIDAGVDPNAYADDDLAAEIGEEATATDGAEVEGWDLDADDLAGTAAGTDGDGPAEVEDETVRSDRGDPIPDEVLDDGADEPEPVPDRARMGSPIQEGTGEEDWTGGFPRTDEAEEPEEPPRGVGQEVVDQGAPIWDRPVHPDQVEYVQEPGKTLDRVRELIGKKSTSIDSDVLVAAVEASHGAIGVICEELGEDTPTRALATAIDQNGSATRIVRDARVPLRLLQDDAVQVTIATKGPEALSALIGRLTTEGERPCTDAMLLGVSQENAMHLVALSGTQDPIVHAVAASVDPVLYARTVAMGDRPREAQEILNGEAVPVDVERYRAHLERRAEVTVRNAKEDTVKRGVMPYPEEVLELDDCRQTVNVDCPHGCSHANDWVPAQVGRGEEERGCDGCGEPIRYTPILDDATVVATDVKVPAAEEKVGPVVSPFTTQNGSASFPCPNDECDRDISVDLMGPLAQGERYDNETCRADRGGCGTHVKVQFDTEAGTCTIATTGRETDADKLRAKAAGATHRPPQAAGETDLPLERLGRDEPRKGRRVTRILATVLGLGLTMLVALAVVRPASERATDQNGGTTEQTTESRTPGVTEPAPPVVEPIPTKPAAEPDAGTAREKAREKVEEIRARQAAAREAKKGGEGLETSTRKASRTRAKKGSPLDVRSRIRGSGKPRKKAAPKPEKRRRRPRHDEYDDMDSVYDTGRLPRGSLDLRERTTKVAKAMKTRVSAKPSTRTGTIRKGRSA